MLEKTIRFSIAHRWFVLLATLAIVIVGVYNFKRLPIDAVPDITNVQVQINTEAPGLSPFEVEQRITFLIETVMSGLPALDYTRSISRYGLSQVTVIFKDGTNIYFARQLINERLQEIKNKLPPHANPAIGPISTGLGEIFMYTVNNSTPQRQYSPTDLRVIQDWIIKPQLRNIAGVAEVNAIGGFVKQYHITPDPSKLIRYHLSLHDLLNSLRRNNSNASAGYIERNGEQYLLSIPGQVKSIDDIKNIVITNFQGVPIRISDVAHVGLGKELRTGAATENGHEVVLGTVFMLIGENSRTVADRVAKKLDAVNKTLPNGVKANPVYNRTKLVNATIDTVRNNLLEGALLVCAVLFLFLGNIRAALITAAVIPLSMLLTISGMVSNKISANLMSLGALDFGLIVDGSIIIVENFLTKLNEQQQHLKRVLKQDERLHLIETAMCEVVRPSIFGVFIITVVYLPILTLTGIEGKMFIPMAATVIMALLSSIVFALTFVPAAMAIFLRRNQSQKEYSVMQYAKKGYLVLLTACFPWRKWVFFTASILVLSSIILATRLGGEFIPNLEEGDIALHALRIPSTSLTQAVKMQHLLERRLAKFPEVERVFSKLGTAEIATDPVPPSVADTFVMLNPRSKWPNPNKTKLQLFDEMEKAVQKIPGNKYEFTQPIEMRFNELISGVRSDVAIKVFGDDIYVLLKKAENISHIVEGIPGAIDVQVEQVTGLPLLTIAIDHHRLSRYGLEIADVQETLQIALGGKKGGEIFEGDKRFDLVVRLPETLRTDPDVLQHIFIPLVKSPNAVKHFIPLSEVASIQLDESPNQISRENGKRRVVVTTNVRGRDLSSFVTELKKLIEEKIQLPSGYWLRFGGQFEHLESASQRLAIVVPVTLLLIFLCLFTALGNAHDALLVFTGIPLALTGGVFSLWLRHIPLSISAGVGFIALSGIAVLNGLVMITFINKLRKQENINLQQAVVKGSLARLRPVLMTALVASLGFLPMALATGIGSEVQRPLATVVIGGIISSTFLTLLVLPGMYFSLHQYKSRFHGWVPMRG